MRKSNVKRWELFVFTRQKSEYKNCSLSDSLDSDYSLFDAPLPIREHNRLIHLNTEVLLLCGGVSSMGDRFNVVFGAL
jgi:hypothetical protein